MRSISMIILGAICMLPFSSFNFLTAECAKCVKIEAEREEEKARNPKPQSEYYEDQLSLNEDPAIKRLQDQDLRLNDAEGLKTPKNLNAADRSLPSYSQKETAAYPPSIIYSILESKDVIETLKKPFTIFVPSNDALKHIPVQHMQTILNPERSEQLNNLVRNHLVAKKIAKNDFSSQPLAVQSINNFPILLKETNGEFTVNGHKILRVDQLGNDGMIYVVDQLLINQ